MVINSLDIARDTLENRSAIYSDRPRFVMGRELCGWNRTTPMSSDGHRFRSHRTFFAQRFSTNRSVEKYHLMMEDSARQLASRLASDSHDLIEKIYLYASACVFYRRLGRLISFQFFGEPSVVRHLWLRRSGPARLNHRPHERYDKLLLYHHQTGCIRGGCFPIP